MSENSGINQVELGRYLMQVRDRADMKQAELARIINWSPAVLSRVETGERPVTQEELRIILTAIGTPEAARAQEASQREWAVLPRPSLDHPDQDWLWDAEQIATELVALRERPDVRNAFERRISAYLEEIQQTAALLLKRDHQIAFIGSIGIGKSTAICRLTGLEILGQDGGPPVPVLEAGGGGITICEVHLRKGPGYGLMIEPRSDDEIRAYVTDFAELLLNGSGTDLVDEPDIDAQGISSEIARAIRNMAGFKSRRIRTGDGKTSRRDDARELAKKCSTVRELVVEILARMELHKRDRRDIWYDSSCGKPTLTWVKDTFEEVNNGRHPEFRLPKRIDVVIPSSLLDVTDLSVRIIDTKGIDRTAARGDLEMHLDDPHTVAVLCSAFNNAPAAEPRLLLERARESGIRTLETHSTLLVLPRPNEAMAVKDESGIRVETPEEGYELKGEQALMALHPLGLHNYSICFYNAYQDNPAILREFLIKRISTVRNTFRTRLEEITTNARALLLNHEQAQVQEVISHAASMLRSWASQHAKVRKPKAHVHDSLMGQLAQAYASTIRATVRREGEWSNLSYSYHLGYGARRIAAFSLGKTVEGFSELCKTMKGNPDYTEANDLINQAERVLLVSYEELLRKVYVMGQTSFREELKVDSRFWLTCENEWGEGPGYRSRITNHNVNWFDAEPRQELESQLRLLIEREWKDALANLTSLFESEQ